MFSPDSSNGIAVSNQLTFPTWNYGQATYAYESGRPNGQPQPTVPPMNGVVPNGANGTGITPVQTENAIPPKNPPGSQQVEEIQDDDVFLPRIPMPTKESADALASRASADIGGPSSLVKNLAKKISLDMRKSVEVEKERKSMDSAAIKDKDDGGFRESHGLTTAEAEDLLKKWGRNELKEKKTPTWVIIFRLLTGPMPIMLWVASIIEAVIENYADFGILLGIQFINASISFYETSKAGNAVAALKKSLKPLATVKRDGKWQNVDAGGIAPGDLVLLAAGSAVPADCWVNHGEIEVDQSAMTGESLPVKFRRGDVCKMGSTVTRGEVEGTVESTGANTLFGKTAAMLQGVENSGGSLRTLLIQMMIILVTLSLALCITALIYLVIVGNQTNNELPPIHRETYDKIVKDALGFAVVVLVATIPLAVEIVTTTTLAVGSRHLSKHGAIVTKLTAIEEMAGMDMLCSDKTGTLTLNKMVVQDECPTYTDGENKDTIMFQAALAAKWKEPPRDALDTMILKTALDLPQGDDPGSEVGKANLARLNEYTQLDFTPFDPRTKRTEGKLKGPDGKVFRITKGAPHVIVGLCNNKDEIKKDVDGKVNALGKRGIRSLAVGRMEEDEGNWRLLGILTFLDPPRADTKETIENANKFGVEVKMITGDHKVVAVETARTLGMGTTIQGCGRLPTLGEGGKTPDNLPERYGALIVPSCGFAQVFPEHKYLIVECLRQVGYRVGMTGDGVNDAPALKRADVGIAVQGSTDAARAAADIVLTGDGLSVCIEAIKIARQIFTRLKNFLTYRISVSLQLLVFFFIAVFSLAPRDYYRKNGLKGIDTASGNPLYGGTMNQTIFDRIQWFALPRKSWKCPTGYVDGAFNQYSDSVITTNTMTFTSVQQNNQQSTSKFFTAVSPGAPVVTSFFDIDAMNPANPLTLQSGSWSSGCDIILPVCSNTTVCVGGTGVCLNHQECEEWPYSFQLPVLMLMLITLLNDGALISIGYDKVTPSPVPERWNLKLLFTISAVLGAVACGSSLLLLWAALDSNNPSGVFAGMGLPPMEYGKIVTMMYLKVSLTNFLTLFSARTQDNFFWVTSPSPILMWAALISLIISTFLASFWPTGELDGLPVMGLALGDYTLMPLWVWIYCIICWLIQDVFKVITIYICSRMAVFKPFTVDRKKWEKLAEQLPPEPEDKH